MRSALYACVLVAASTTGAIAQPGSETEESQPVTTSAPVMATSSVSAHERRPEGNSVGLGVGYYFEFGAVDTTTDGHRLWNPNITSARFRLESGLTIEPSVILMRSGTTTEAGDAEASAAETTIELGAAARYPLRSRGRVDLVAVGGARIGMSSSDPNTDVDDDKMSTTSAALIWGIGLDYWLSPTWQFSITAMNPFFQHTKTTTEQGPDAESSTSQTDIGIVWSPTMTAMLHMYL